VEARILDVLDESERVFGAAARERYALLIEQAMQDVADVPGRPAARIAANIDARVRFYHIRHSRERIADPADRVGRPRHILVFEVGEDGIVEILGLIPDAMQTGRAVRRFIPEL
jgi:toxin ParE1/3/4